MSANRWFKPLVIIALAAVAVLTVREAVATSAVVQQGESERAGLADNTLGKPLNEYSPSEASAYRWQAMGRYYQEHGLLAGSALQKPLTAYNAAEASAYRWQAMADYYERHGRLAGVQQLPQTGSALRKPLNEYNAAEASAYRWNAMAKYYQEHGMLLGTKP